MDDSSLYTGVDEVPTGVFGNEVKDKETEQLLQEQRAKLQELTPKLATILDMIDKEIALVMSIDRFGSATSVPEADIRSELQAAALYKQYLDILKTKFTIVLRETK